MKPEWNFSQSRCVIKFVRISFIMEPTPVQQRKRRARKPISKSPINNASKISLKPLPKDKTLRHQAYNETILCVSGKKKSVIYNWIIKWLECLLKKSNENPNHGAFPPILVLLSVFKDVLNKRGISTIMVKGFF